MEELKQHDARFRWWSRFILTWDSSKDFIKFTTLWMEYYCRFW